MKLQLGRIVILSVVSITATAVFGSCASSEEGLWPESGGDASHESGEASSFGGIGGGVGTGGGFSGFGGTTGGSFGTGGSPFGGTGGTPGTGGGVATGGGAGTTGSGGVGSGTCNPAFCPSSSVGTACCVTPNGPCGLNSGSACTTAAADF